MIDLEPATSCFVANFDMLGFSSLLESDLDRAWPLLCDFERLRSEKSLKLYEFDRRPIRAEVLFSDTVLLVTYDDSINSLHAILKRSLELFAAGFKSCIPLRGAIAHGPFILSNLPLLFAGPAFLKAHQLSESQQFLGVSLDTQTAAKLQGCLMPNVRGPQSVFPWDVPLKEGTENRVVLNWLAAIDAALRPCSGQSAEEFQGRFSELGTWACLTSEARQKYENTVKFLAAAESA